jgi:hypothetical protein
MAALGNDGEMSDRRGVSLVVLQRHTAGSRRAYRFTS